MKALFKNIPVSIRVVLSWRIVKAVISAVLLGLAVSRFGPTEILNSMKGANLFLLFAAGIAFIASGFAGAAQWGILLDFHCIKQSYHKTAQRYFTGLFFNFVLPGFMGGDIVRMYQTTKAHGQATAAVCSTLADRLVGFIVLIFFSLGAFLFLPGGPAMQVLPVTGLMFSILAVVTFTLSVKPAGRFVEKVACKILPSSWGEKIGLMFVEMHTLTRSPSTLATVVLTSVVIQLLRIMVHYLCGRAVGIEAGFTYYALFVPLMEIAASVPISMGGIGIREAMGVALFSTVGIDKAGVVAYSLLATITGFVCSIPGGIAFALAGREKKVADTAAQLDGP